MNAFPKPPPQMLATRVFALALVAAHLMSLPAGAQVSEDVLASIATPTWRR